MQNNFTYIGNLSNNSNPINIIICGTHNNRLECFFAKLNKNNKSYISKVFNNCVIIRCFKINGIVKFNMIYEGELSNDNAMSCFNSNSCWNIKDFNNYFNSLITDINIPDNLEIFLIRHGQGVHNRANFIEKIYNNVSDAMLDDIGTTQAINAGRFLQGYIKTYYTYIHIFWEASHLIRTQQTIGLIMREFKIKTSKIINIAPCTHELIFKSDGECDSALRQIIPVSSNIPRCNINTIEIDNTCKLLTKFNIYDTIKDSIRINWDYYTFFYKSLQKCEDTDMLSEIVKTFNTPF